MKPYLAWGLGSSPALLRALAADPGWDSPIGPIHPAFVLRVLLAEVHGLLLCSLCSSLWRVETEQPVSTGLVLARLLQLSPLEGCARSLSLTVLVYSLFFRSRRSLQHPDLQRSFCSL